MKKISKFFLMLVVFSLQGSAVAGGKELFTGAKKFSRGGPACIACHSLSGLGVPGGKLAPSLDDTADNFSLEELVEFLGSEDSPVMAAAYRDRQLTEREKQEVAAYLTGSSAQGDDGGGNLTLLAIIAGVVLFLITGAAKVSLFA